VSRRLVRAIGKVSSSSATAEQQLRDSIGRIGARVGDLEQSRALDRVRRYQLEATLRARGIDLPPWPDDEDQAANEVADLSTAHLETQYFIPPRPAPRRTS
jgi:ABC-type transporter Mla subunit MlaD